MSPKRTRTYFMLAGLTLLIVFLINLSMVSVNIPLMDTLKTVYGKSIAHGAWHDIILQYRLPKAMTAVLVGSGLALSGLLMQTLFRNPLAGPYILGLSSGASLGVALIIMGSSLFGGVFAGLILSK